MEKHALERKALQGAVLIAACVPVFAGGWGVLHGLAGADAWAVNHQRYLSGLLLAIGFAFWSAIPAIESKTARVRLLTFIVVIGGLCRLLGVALGDPPSLTTLGALAMELLVTPALCLWQSRLCGPAMRNVGPVTSAPQLDS
ncbi:MAG: DUF4345 domain-containing protein [Rhodospirillales bacterium]